MIRSMPCALRVLIVAGLAACTAPSAPKSMASSEPVSALATGADGVRLQYLDFGGAGPPILLLPGAGNSAWIYGDLGKELARDHRVFALTRRGHGDSEQPATGYDVATLDEDIVRFLDAMKVTRVVLVGHSLAGVELTYFASHHPDRVSALIYLDASYDRSTQEAVMEGAPYSPPPPTDSDRTSIDSMIAYVRRTRLDLARHWYGPTVRDAEASIVMRDGTAGWRAAPIFGEYWTATSKDPPDYSKITAPVLAIFAVENERYQLPADASDELLAKLRQWETGALQAWRESSKAQLLRAVPSAQIIEMDAGHHMFLHRPAETLAHLRKFLARTRARQPDRPAVMR